VRVRFNIVYYRINKAGNGAGHVHHGFKEGEGILSRLDVLSTTGQVRLTQGEAVVRLRSGAPLLGHLGDVNADVTGTETDACSDCPVRVRVGGGSRLVVPCHGILRPRRVDASHLGGPGGAVVNPIQAGREVSGVRKLGRQTQRVDAYVRTETGGISNEKLTVRPEVAVRKNADCVRVLRNQSVKPDTTSVRRPRRAGDYQPDNRQHHHRLLQHLSSPSFRDYGFVLRTMP